jgi:hypothetical protein
VSEAYCRTHRYEVNTNDMHSRTAGGLELRPSRAFPYILKAKYDTEVRMHSCSAQRAIGSSGVERVLLCPSVSGRSGACHRAQADAAARSVDVRRQLRSQEWPTHRPELPLLAKPSNMNMGFPVCIHIPVRGLSAGVPDFERVRGGKGREARDLLMPRSKKACAFRGRLTDPLGPPSTLGCGRSHSPAAPVVKSS